MAAFTLQARLHVPAPRLGELKAGQQLAAGEAEQVRHRDLAAEREQRCVNAVLQDRAMLDQVQPPPGALALGTQLRGRQPDRWDKIAEGELGKHARVDLG